MASAPIADLYYGLPTTDSLLPTPDSRLPTDPATRANGLHRAEVSKLLVARSARRQGLGRRLMLALEMVAQRLGRTTIVLDTRQGDPSEALYAGLGYHLVGAIPAYARSADGSLHATAFYYKLLAGAGAAD